MTRPRTTSASFSIVSLIGCSSSRFHIGEVRMHPQAFPKRSLSAGLAQQFRCCTERREIIARRNGLDEVPELLTHCLIGKSTGEGVQRPKLQPARPLLGGELDGVA